MGRTVRCPCERETSLSYAKRLAEQSNYVLLDLQDQDAYQSHPSLVLS